MPTLTNNEIKQHINRLKNQKSLGIQGEILKSLDKNSISRIQSVIERIWLEKYCASMP